MVDVEKVYEEFKKANVQLNDISIKLDKLIVVVKAVLKQ